MRMTGASHVLAVSEPATAVRWTPAGVSAALDRILPQVEKPARYSGGEWNAIVKDWDRLDVTMAICYPDVYEVGMSNLGIQILYDLVNAEEWACCERVYAPWPDMEQKLRQYGVPLYSLETRHPLGDFDIIGFSLAYEMIFSNALTVLDLAGIPLTAAERTEAHPLIIAGGSGVLNPEPMADFIDLFILGEAEDTLLEFLQLYRRHKAQSPLGRPERARLLREAAQIPGVYVPSLYHVTYNPDGTIQSIKPAEPGVPAFIERQKVDFTCKPLPVRPIVPFIETVHDRAMIEIMRGCVHGCRFCQAMFIYSPVRMMPSKKILEAAEQLLANTGYDELALLSLSSADYRGINELIKALSEKFGDNLMSISLPSTRVDAFSVQLAELIHHRRKGGMTFAPEAGTERLREVINKGVSEEEIMRAVRTAYSSGWQQIKLYFMIGLPTETLEDVRGIVRLAHKVLEVGREYHGRRARVHVGVSTFVPKAHTPFQWVGQDTRESIIEKQRILREGLRHPNIRFHWNDPNESVLEAILSRGDRRVGRAIRRAWELGARFDAWSDQFKWAAWEQALQECGLDSYFYAHRGFGLGETLPWDHIVSRTKRHALIRQYRAALDESSTPLPVVAAKLAAVPA
jgi:radical SAM family uncharacterized protein